MIIFTDKFLIIYFFECMVIPGCPGHITMKWDNSVAHRVVRGTHTFFRHLTVCTWVLCLPHSSGHSSFQYACEFMNFYVIYTNRKMFKIYILIFNYLRYLIMWVIHFIAVLFNCYQWLLNQTLIYTAWLYKNKITLCLVLFLLYGLKVYFTII